MLQGTLDLMVLKTLDVMGPQHGYGIARRIEQVSDDLLPLNEGTVYASLLRLRQQGWIAARLGALGEQPARPVLCHHRGGPPPARGPSGRLGAHRWRHGAPPAAVSGPMSPWRAVVAFVSRVRNLCARRRFAREAEQEEMHLDLLTAQYRRG